MKRIFTNLNRTFSLVLALIVVLLVNIIALTNPTVMPRFDLSGRKFYELSDRTKGLLEGLDEQVLVTVIIQEGHSLSGYIENLLEEYQYESRNIKLRWIDPLRDPARTEKLAMQYELTQAPVVVFDVGGEFKPVMPEDIAIFKRDAKGQETDDIAIFKGEQAFSSAIQGLAQGEAPIVYLLVGHGERRLSDFDLQTGYTRIGNVLQKDNVILRELLLTNEKNVPADAAALVILGPSKKMGQSEVAMIEDYLRRSGRVMILLDAMTETGLGPMLRNYGVALRNDFVVDAENRLREHDVHVRRFYLDQPHPITRDLDTMVRFSLPRSVMPLSLLEGEGDGAEDRPVVMPLAVTSEEGWSETQVNDSPAKYDGETTDLRGHIPLAVAVERGAAKELLDVQIQPSRMVVFGDSDFISNGSMVAGNQDLFMSAMNWLLDREELMAIAPKLYEEIKLSITRKQLSKLAWGSVGGIPALAVVGGLLVWVRRRK